MRKQNQVTNKFISSVLSTGYYPDVISATNKRSSRTKSCPCLSRNGFSLVQSEAFDGEYFPAPTNDSELLKKACYGLPGSCASNYFAKKLSGKEKYGLAEEANPHSDLWKLALLLLAVVCIHILVPKWRPLSTVVVEITHTIKKSNQ